MQMVYSSRRPHWVPNLSAKETGSWGYNLYELSNIGQGIGRTLPGFNFCCHVPMVALWWNGVQAQYQHDVPIKVYLLYLHACTQTFPLWYLSKDFLNKYKSNNPKQKSLHIHTLLPAAHPYKSMTGWENKKEKDVGDTRVSGEERSLQEKEGRGTDDA